MNYKKLAEDALERRSALVNKAKAVDADSRMSPAEKRERIERLNADIETVTAEARSWIERGEREVEVRNLAKGNPLFGPGADREDEDEWRSGIVPSASEYRGTVALGSVDADGGYTVPDQVGKNAVGLLRAKSVFLSAPGLNVLPMDSDLFRVPTLSGWSTAGVVAEGQTITTGSQTFAAGNLPAIKYADLRFASNEVLNDSAIDMRNLIGNEMVRNIANAVDKDAFGAGNGTSALEGLTAAGQSTNTALTTGYTVVRWDHVIDAYISVVSSGAVPTVLWASPDMYGGLLKERATITGTASSQGDYLANSVTSDPLKGAVGLPIKVSANLPVRTVIVADASRVFVGLRQSVSVKVSEDAGFANDTVGFRATYRVGGLYVAEATSVQRVTASAT